MKKIARQRFSSNVSLNGQVSWQYFQSPQSGLWVAVCHPFKLTLQAKSYQELVESMSEVIDCMFRDLAKSGEIEAFLAEHGWTAQRAVPKNPRNLSFDIPFQTQRIEAGDYADAVC